MTTYTQDLTSALLMPKCKLGLRSSSLLEPLLPMIVDWCSWDSGLQGPHPTLKAFLSLPIITVGFRGFINQSAMFNGLL